MREHHADHQAHEQIDDRTARPTGSRSTPPVETDQTAEFWGDAPRWTAGRSIPFDRRTGATPRLRGFAAGLTGSIPVIGGGRRDASGPVARLRPDATGQIPRTRRHGERSAHPADAASATATGPTFAATSTSISASASSISAAVPGSDDAIAWLVRDAIARDEGLESAGFGGPGAAPLSVFDDADTFDSLEPTGPVPVARVERTTRRRDERMGASFGAVDPLLVRLGVIVAVGVLLVPLALAFRSGGDEAAVRTPSAVASGGPALGRDRAVAVEPGALTGSVSEGAGTPGVATTSGEDAAGSDGSVAAAEVAPPTTEPCTRTYEVHEGDYWIRLADESGVRLAELLAHNGATVRTPLYPGAEVCLPRGATMPAPPPTTTVPPTTVAPATTAASSGSSSASSSASSDSGSTTNRQPSSPPATTAPPTTARPTTVPPTTVPPTTAAPQPRASTESPEQVRAIIREIFPEDQHEMAIRVAQRESSFRPGAYNGHCCYGIFQIYWSVHRSWLSDLGITSSAHLLDARANIQAAYVLYQRAGGWGPWRQTAY